MIRIVLDTNIIISAFGWSGNEYNILQKVMNKELLLVLSPEILDEYKRILLLQRLEFQEDEVEEFISALLEVAELIYPIYNKQSSIAIRDKDDIKFIICAIESKADYIITGDNDLLVIDKYNSIQIISSKNFLETLEKNN
ncbi:putative toxin-antitoxin system toxin component, PIN family [Candidatus Woesearchaeota archaeon]|nr:putative toxin-antitoxin system toxin component, PIN family [Candidatus Woesearchaeota archaeon]